MFFNLKHLLFIFFISNIYPLNLRTGMKTKDNFSYTCYNTWISSTGILTSTCRRMSGSYLTSSLNLNSNFGNNNGYLQWGGVGAFNTSYCTMSTSSTLSCEMKRSDSSFNRSSVNLNYYVENNDGRLMFG